MTKNEDDDSFAWKVFFSCWLDGWPPRRSTLVVMEKRSILLYRVPELDDMYKRRR